MICNHVEQLDIFMEKYKVPKDVCGYVPRLFTEKEIIFAVRAPQTFGIMDVEEIFRGTEYEGMIQNSQDAEQYLTKEYRRGFLNLVDDTRTLWKLSDYASFMDVYVVREYEDYISRFTKQEREDIDKKYFNASFAPRAQHPEYAPTNDEVFTLQEILDFIDKKEGQIYLNNCDCRSFAGDCKKLRLTCISYRGGINTYADRGMSKKLSKEEAKEMVRLFDNAGLMHTTNGETICNCCGDCCYLSRGREILGSGPNWPLAHHVVKFWKEKCINCGRCIHRCWMNVFDKNNGAITVDTTKCVGCGLCVNTCPGSALSMEDKTYPGLKRVKQEKKEIQSH